MTLKSALTSPLKSREILDKKVLNKGNINIFYY